MLSTQSIKSTYSRKVGDVNRDERGTVTPCCYPQTPLDAPSLPAKPAAHAWLGTCGMQGPPKPPRTDCQLPPAQSTPPTNDGTKEGKEALVLAEWPRHPLFGPPTATFLMPLV